MDKESRAKVASLKEWPDDDAVIGDLCAPISAKLEPKNKPLVDGDPRRFVAGLNRRKAGK